MRQKLEGDPSFDLIPSDSERIRIFKVIFHFQYSLLKRCASIQNVLFFHVRNFKETWKRLAAIIIRDPKRARKRKRSKNDGHRRQSQNPPLLGILKIIYPDQNSNINGNSILLLRSESRSKSRSKSRTPSKSNDDEDQPAMRSEEPPPTPKKNKKKKSKKKKERSRSV